MIGPNPQVRAANLYLFARFCLFVTSCFNVSGALVCAGTEIRQDVRPRTYRTRFLVFTINRNNLTHPGIWRIKASLKSALRMPLKARQDRDISLREYTYRCGYGKRRDARFECDPRLICVTLVLFFTFFAPFRGYYVFFG